MARKRKDAKASRVDPATEAFLLGSALVAKHPLFAHLCKWARFHRHQGNRCPKDAWAVVGADGDVLVHPTRRGTPDEWAYVLAHCLLHLGFGHFDVRDNPLEWNAACDCFIAQLLASLKLGRAPREYLCPTEYSTGTEQQLYRRILDRGVWPGYVGDMVEVSLEAPAYGREAKWGELLAVGLADAVDSAVRVAAGVEPTLGSSESKVGRLQSAREWLINSYPLIGSLLAAFTLVEDARVCMQEGISVAAIDDQIREIYISPGAALDEEECRFVLAHEVLHAGLRHAARRQGRDPFLWNVSADYTINGWLIEMGIGTPPSVGMLHDPALRGMSAESIYDLIVTDLRRYRKVATLRGIGAGDMLERRSSEWWSSTEGMDLDAFYRRALAQGLLYHEDQGRGLLPAGLIEEIRALALPPIPWDVELARWFDERFPPLEKVRSYARPSRRQASTPDIPRPSYVVPPGAYEGRTFGVVLDTSGSMGRNLLAKALGSIASYAVSRDVPLVRVVFCDAAPYDQGYMPAEAIADRVKVRGRGGTILQPGIDLLEKAGDFPKEGPVLIITDGRCDVLTVRRDHAFLIPEGHDLPFVPKGKVFRIPS